jgi:hypothetical protein
MELFNLRLEDLEITITESFPPTTGVPIDTKPNRTISYAQPAHPLAFTAA